MLFRSPRQDVPQSAVDEFVAESEETVDRLSRNLQAMEAGSSSKELIDEIYRDVHSLKGSAFLFSYNNLGQVAHAMESSLERVRNGTHAHSPELLNGLFKSLTLMEGLVSKIKTNEPIEEIVQKIPEVIQIGRAHV